MMKWMKVLEGMLQYSCTGNTRVQRQKPALKPTSREKGLNRLTLPKMSIPAVYNVHRNLRKTWEKIVSSVQGWGFRVLF